MIRFKQYLEEKEKNPAMNLLIKDLIKGFKAFRILNDDETKKIISIWNKFKGSADDFIFGGKLEKMVTPTQFKLILNHMR